MNVGKLLLILCIFTTIAIISLSFQDTNLNKKVINTDKAPAPIGPYNQAIEAGGFIFVSGQIGINPATGKIETNDIKKETRQVMENINAILKKGGVNFSNVVKSAIFLSDMSDFEAVNEVYGSYFGNDAPPRETVGVKKLPKDAGVEISVIVIK